MPPKSDSQRDAVYLLEAELNGSWAFAEAPTKKLDSLLLMACRYYNVETPILKVIRSRKHQEAAWFIHDKIFLNRAREGANGMVLLHEVAHYLVDCFYTNTEQHGPEFCAIYMHLLDKYAFLPHDCFRLLAKRFKLRIGRRYRPVAFKLVGS